MESLHEAAAAGNVALVRTLLSHAESLDVPDERGWTPLMAGTPFPELVELLLRAGADPCFASPEGESVLMVAARIASVTTIRLLVQAGAAVSGADDLGNTPLMEAAAAGNVETLQALIELGADPNECTVTGSTALFAAAREGEHYAARALLEAGADPNHRIVSGPRLGQRAIDLASEYDNLLTVAALDVGKDADDGDSG